MSASPSLAVPRLFYHPAYWCHSCDMSIGLPPSPTPNALLCPHCHRDALEQMEMEEHISPPSPDPPRNPFSSSAAAAFTFAPSDDNFLLSSPYLHRLIHHLTTASDESDPRSDPALKSSIESLQELTITPESDPTMLCPVCKDPFIVESLPSVDEARMESGGEGHVGSAALEELADDEMDLFGFRNTLRHIARRKRWNEDVNIGRGSEGNLFSPTQIGEVERVDRVLERQNSVETLSSWPRWQAERGGGNDDIDAFPRS
ncbi:hypothetical protein OROGR_031809 [Orobanche gracilis]